MPHLKQIIFNHINTSFLNNGEITGNGKLILPQTSTIVDTNDWYIGIGKDVGQGASAAVSIGYLAGNTDQHSKLLPLVLMLVKPVKLG